MITPDYQSTQEFYERESVWRYDFWHAITRRRIRRLLSRFAIPSESQILILNVGSGGETYDLMPEKQVHVDLIVSRLAGRRGIVSDAMRLPLKSGSVGAAICVGSVINHCEAERVICELARVIRRGGTIALEFDSSDGLHHLNTGLRGMQEAVVQTFYNGTTVGLTEYSVEYVVDIARRAGVQVYARESFHILSAAGLAFGLPPPLAAPMAALDLIARCFPQIQFAGSNVMLFGYRY